MSWLKQKYIVFIALAVYWVIPAAADPLYPALAESRDPALQWNLEQTLHDFGLTSAARKNALSVALVDITEPQHPRVAAVNGDHMMYAASLPKIAILLGAFKHIENDEMALDEETRDQLTRMIRFSSNQAATTMLNRVGKQYLAELLQSPQYRLYDRNNNGGLWVGKEYGKQPAWKRDPLHNISHGATAFQVARFYYLLETSQLLSDELTREMKAMLGQPGINHKFVKGLNDSRPGSNIFRKSGSWRQWHADSAIVEREGRRYIAVALAESPHGGKWLERLIVGLDNLVFGRMRVAALN
jgi:beta-lactamase class A